MTKEGEASEKTSISLLFLIIPTFFLIFSYYFLPFPEVIDPGIIRILQVPLFLGLAILLIGFLAGFFTKNRTGNAIKILGWIIFAFYWSTQPSSLFLGGEKDVFNAVVCVIGVYVLFYLSYHEWLSYIRKDNISCINWIAGASAFAGLIYFGVEQTYLAPLLIKEVARQSVWVLSLFMGDIELGTCVTNGCFILLEGQVVVKIIFACTAIQSMVIFVGMIGALPKIDLKRRIIGLAITVIPVYFLNLLRNALVVYLTGNNITNFFMAHNVISKIGSLIALIVLLIIVIKILPEIFDEIIGLTDIYKREGALEKVFSRIWGKK